MSKIKGLKCKECAQQTPLVAKHVCEFCFGPLEVEYDYDFIRKEISKEVILNRPANLWRYWELLPVESRNIVSLNEGFTPLWKSRNLGKFLGLKNLYIKNDSVNPTFSFKDRVVTVALTRSRELGFDVVACASTGNLAGSVAAYGSVGHFKTFVFIPADLESGKIVGAGVYEPIIVGIKGTYDEVNRLCAEVADVFNWAFVNVNIRPYYSEGSKTLGFEVAEQLDWRAPDHVVVPAASGSLLTKVYKGLWEFQNLGLIPEFHTKISAAQAQGCSPIVTAIQEKSDIIKPVVPQTIAKSIAIGNPADGYYAAQTAIKTGGNGETATDEEIIEGIQLLARHEGVFTETAGGTTVAVLKKLVESSRIEKDETVVVYITGNGLKTQESVQDKVSKPHLIQAKLKDFRELYDGLMKKKKLQAVSQ